MPLSLGVCIASDISDIDYAVLAEQLGYSHLWFADSQMIWSDCYATMALAAARTSTIRIGTGVAVAGTRTAPVTASSHATINRIAPGRVFCGIGTGNTAMRVMGHRPMPIAEFEAYIATLQPLLRGEETDLVWRNRTAPVRHLMPDLGFVDFTHPMPLYISGFGPRAMALAARHGDGLVMSVPPRAEAVERVWTRLRAAAEAVGRHIDPSNFFTSTLTTAFVLREGEPVDSPRVREGVGAFAVAGLHYAYEQWREAGRPEVPPRFPLWNEYVAMLDEIDPARLHQRIHQGHNCWVLPEEERFVTAELIMASCLVATAPDMVVRFRELEAAGLSQIMLLPPLLGKEEVLREIAAVHAQLVQSPRI
jgi:5,10-methylenetetrahydromethanopterin reductase